MTAARSGQELDIDLHLYAQMALIRQFEEVAYRAYEAGEIVGTLHASIGQEGTAVGVITALEAQDKVLSHHRAHGHALTRGVDPGRLMAELLGRELGVSAGKGGSMHVTDVNHGFLGSLAVVGGSVPVAMGVALAARVLGETSICCVFFGDGAVNQGVLYESLNLAAIWSLPVLFACENNSFAISVPAEYSTAGPGIVERAKAFGVRADTVDGQDVRAVRVATKTLIEFIRTGRPALLECRTYRFVGHSRGDPPHGIYRSKEEVDHWRERDPLRVHAASAGLSAEECERLDAEARRQVGKALEFARAAPVPPPEAAMKDVWGD